MFYWIVLVTSAISMVFLAFYMFGINIGYRTINYYSNSPTQHYVKWLIFAIYRSSTEIRLCGIFNEPGALGTVCALLFSIRYEHSKRGEKVLMILTILCTVSLAGFLLIFLFFAVKSVMRSKKNIFYLLLLMCFVGVILLLPYIDFENKALNNFANRLRIVNGVLAGDNRMSSAFSSFYDAFIKSGDKWFGLGTDYIELGGSSYKSYVIEYGIIGFGFLMFLWLRNGLRWAERNKDCILFIVLFFASLYQRPELLKSIYGYVLMFGGIAWMQLQTRAEAAKHPT